MGCILKTAAHSTAERSSGGLLDGRGDHRRHRENKAVTYKLTVLFILRFVPG